MLTTWTLVLILSFGTAQQEERVIGQRIPSWDECMARAFHELRWFKHRQPYGVRCEPSLGDRI